MPKSQRLPRLRQRLAIVGLIVLIVTGLAATSFNHVPGSGIAKADAAAVGIHKIKHVVIIMQENRSFDNYFGTYPGAAGIPMSGGVPTVCVPDPKFGGCIKPYVDHTDNSLGGPHGSVSSKLDVNGGKMNGFIGAAETTPPDTLDCGSTVSSTCARAVMGYHTASDIPNYWTYANDFVLQDHMFEPNASWSLPAHLFMTSGWSATCTKANVPASCTNDLNQNKVISEIGATGSTKLPTGTNFAWTDMTYLMFKKHVSWGYYVLPGTQPDCINDANSCAPIPQSASTPGIWNPLPYFNTIQKDGQLGNIKSTATFYAQAQFGTLPAVSWVNPAYSVSEHAPASIAAGQAYTTSLINAVMSGPNWSSTAIFLAWDDWGGFYDGVNPPTVDLNGYGMRVPGMVISPYAKHGYVDHQTLSFDAYNKFIEDDFLSSQRLDPKTDGRPDPRPSVRENKGILGNLANDFNFNQTPRAPIILPVHPATTLTHTTPFGPYIHSYAAGNGQANLQIYGPKSNGGLPITSYVLTPTQVGGPLQLPLTYGPATTNFVVSGLQNGKTYQFKLQAVNALGAGMPALTTPLVIGAPLPPTGVSAAPAKVSAVVRWHPPTSNNGAPITGYNITGYNGTTVVGTVIEPASATAMTFHNLVAGKSYSFTVIATNARGKSRPATTNVIKPTA